MLKKIINSEILLIGFPDGVLYQLISTIESLKPGSRVVTMDEQKAIQALKKRPASLQPSLIFISPGLIESFLWKAKAQSWLRQTPVLVLGSLLPVDDVQRAYQLGANSVILLAQETSGLLSKLDTTLSYWFEYCQLPQGFYLPVSINED